MPSDELPHKARILSASKHFMDVAPAPLQNKQVIFLTLCGKKPVSHAFSAQWIEKRGSMYSRPDDEQGVGELLKQLGLVFTLASDENGTWVTVSLDQSLLKKMSSSDDRALGRLLGYPESAVLAYGIDDMLEIEEQDKLMEAAGLPITMPQFCMSKSHADEELELLKDWYETLRHYGLGG